MDFKLRPWTIEDLDSLVKFANNFNIAKNLTDAFPHPYSIENGKAFIEMASQNTPRNILAIEIMVKPPVLVVCIHKKMCIAKTQN